MMRLAKKEKIGIVWKKMLRSRILKKLKEWKKRNIQNDLEENEFHEQLKKKKVNIEEIKPETTNTNSPILINFALYSGVIPNSFHANCNKLISSSKASSFIILFVSEIFSKLGRNDGGTKFFFWSTMYNFGGICDAEWGRFIFNNYYYKFSY